MNSEELSVEKKVCNNQGCANLLIQGSNFCSKCGAPVDPESNRINQFIKSTVTNELEKYSSEKWGDRQQIELTLSQAVAARLIRWAKIFSLFVAVPLGILVIILTILGITKFTDFTKRVDAANRSFSIKAETVNDYADSLLIDYKDHYELIEKLRTRLPSIEESIEGNRQKINEVGRILGDTLIELPTWLRGDVEREVAKYNGYLLSIGFKPLTNIPAFYISVSDISMDNIYYDPNENHVVIGQRLTSEIDGILAEYTYPFLLRAIDELETLSSFNSAMVIGFSDYFVGSYNDDPKFGKVIASLLKFEKGYIRNLDNDRKFSDLPDFGDDFTIPPFDLGETWGGLLWSLRQEMGAENIEPVIVAAWQEISNIGNDQGLTESVKSFGQSLLAKDPTHIEDYDSIIRRAFANRGILLIR